MQAINVQSTAQYHREGQSNNNTFSQSIEKDPQVKSNGGGVQGEQGDGGTAEVVRYRGHILVTGTFCWIRAPLLCCGSWEKMAWLLPAFGFSTLVL